MKAAVLTGAAGFSGAVLTETLVKEGYRVYALVRPGGAHNERLRSLPEESCILTECGLDEYASLPELLPELPGAFFFHLALKGGQTPEEQEKNVLYAEAALRAAHALGCSRFIAAGSQAEYGVVDTDVIETEELPPWPVTAYGKAKVEACNRTKALAGELGIDWVWGRIFSLIGKYEPSGRMLPDLYHSLKRGEDFHLSSCAQNWDYLDVCDAARAFVALAERGKDGEIYNIANGDFRPLREYTEMVREALSSGARIIYGDDPDPFISLQPSVKKIKKHTGWVPERSFYDSLRDYD
ncbi:MAG: NAD(P)-dependent oxidoreductase [Lachnospiraceae bacterium]|nr:NAD(P)-dependent oxidoreductase [Lachnospiraceae bacterium]